MEGVKDCQKEEFTMDTSPLIRFINSAFHCTCHLQNCPCIPAAAQATGRGRCHLQWARVFADLSHSPPCQPERSNEAQLHWRHGKRLHTGQRVGYRRKQNLLKSKLLLCYLPLWCTSVCRMGNIWTFTSISFLPTFCPTGGRKAASPLKTERAWPPKLTELLPEFSNLLAGCVKFS